MSYTKADTVIGIDRLRDLTSVDLSGSPIVDIRPLIALSELEILNLSLTKVTDWKPLQTLKSLRILNVSFTDFSDAKILDGLVNLQQTVDSQYEGERFGP